MLFTMRVNLSSLLTVISCLLLLSLINCASRGPNRVPSDRFNYIEAIATSDTEQELANIVRARYFGIPNFLVVSSVVTQYTYSGDIGIGGGFFANTSEQFFDGSVNLGYVERPTISYTPIQGHEFAKRILNPIPLDAIFSLVETGWPVDLGTMLYMTLQQIQDVYNPLLDIYLADPANSDMSQKVQSDRERTREFKRVINLIVKLEKMDAIEIQIINEKSYLVFNEQASSNVSAQIHEFKNILGLDPKINSFKITDRTIGRKPNEITFESRSMIAIITILARGIEIPTEHSEKGWVSDIGDEFQNPSLPLRIYSDQERPKDAYAAIRYQGYWFYIKNNDLASKRTLGLLGYFFKILAPVQDDTAPILTLPAGP
jgi:hypothetical protein